MKDSKAYYFSGHPLFSKAEEILYRVAPTGMVAPTHVAMEAGASWHEAKRALLILVERGIAEQLRNGQFRLKEHA